jgi:hypothetical protein
MAAFEDMSDVLDLLSTGTYTVTRPGLTTYVDGVRTVAAGTQFTITAAVQPLKGLELQRLPDGFRNGEVLACFTATELRTVDTGEPDLVTIDGRAHQVESCANWSNSGNFWRAILVRPA